MEDNRRQSEDNYQLILLSHQHIPVIYQWNIRVKCPERYSCRPLQPIGTLNEYTSKILARISDEGRVMYVFVRNDDIDKPIGRITLFDMNIRNHSAEFGFYLPEENRGQGLGHAMVLQFLQTIFDDDLLMLNKIYATTSSNNEPTKNLLEKCVFTLEGRLREHYWIDDKHYDQLIYSLLKHEWRDQSPNIRTN